MATTAAIFFSVLMAGLAVFQLALALGAPIGHFAWGGQHRVLPRGLRIGSLVAIALYTLFSLIVLMHAGLIEPWLGPGWTTPALWVVIAYTALGIFANAISRSRAERLTMTPLVAVLVILMLVVVLA